MNNAFGFLHSESMCMNSVVNVHTRYTYIYIYISVQLQRREGIKILNNHTWMSL